MVRAALRLGSRTIPAAQQRRVADNPWLRGAMMQGTHMALLRSLCDCLVLSGYHGPAVQAVVSAVDLPSCVRRDVRPQTGRLLLGREVWYPPQVKALVVILGDGGGGLVDLREHGRHTLGGRSSS